jgi:signal transduction histidine kinase
MAGRPRRPTLPLVDPSRRRPALPPWSDVVLAGGFFAVSLAQVLVEPIAGPVTSLVVAVGSTAPLAWRRVAPTAAAFVGTAIWLVPTPRGFLFLGFAMAVVLFFSVGAHTRDLRRVLLVTGFGIAVGVVSVLNGPQEPPVAIGAALAVAAPATAGRLVAHSRAQNARLRELTAELVRERAAAERTAITEERARIARELHDVIGHEVSVIALQADAAAAALRSMPERAAAPVATIRAAAGTALTEMRRVVGLLREDTGGGDRQPQPGLADLPGLVASAEAAGTPVEIRLQPPERPLDPGLQLTVYRLVQEALTNARRHAPGSTVRVCVDGTPGELRVEVVSTGGRVGRMTGGGHGLIGMRERVRMHGGALATGPTDGGFAVRARLPLVPPAAP